MRREEWEEGIVGVVGVEMCNGVKDGTDWARVGLTSGNTSELFSFESVFF